MPTVGTLVVALEVDVEGLRKGLDTAAALVGQAARRMEARVEGSRIFGEGLLRGFTGYRLSPAG